MDADGAVVADADDCSAVHVETGLDADRLRAALVATATGVLAERGSAPDVVVLDVAVLRSRATLWRPDPTGRSVSTGCWRARESG